MIRGMPVAWCLGLPRHLSSWRLPALAACLAALAIVPAPALSQEPEAAASPPAKQGTTLSVTFEPSTMAGVPHYVTARLVADDGSAVVDERVTIRRTADVFGGRTVTLGRASTDNAGLARVAVEPREEVYHISATFPGSDTLAASEVADDIVFPTELVVLPEHAPQGGIVDPQLRPLADTMPLVIGGAVILIWVVLLVLTVVTLAGIRSAGRDREVAATSPRAEMSGTGPGSQSQNP